MAALIPDERCFVLGYFLANENETGYIRDQCSHLQGDGASLGWGRHPSVLNKTYNLGATILMELAWF